MFYDDIMNNNFGVQNQNQFLILLFQNSNFCFCLNDYVPIQDRQAAMPGRSLSKAANNGSGASTNPEGTVSSTIMMRYFFLTVP